MKNLYKVAKKLEKKLAQRPVDQDMIEKRNSMAKQIKALLQENFGMQSKKDYAGEVRWIPAQQNSLGYWNINLNLARQHKQKAGSVKQTIDKEFFLDEVATSVT